MSDNIKIFVLILIIAFIATAVILKYKGPVTTDIIIQSSISFAYFLLFCSLYFIISNIIAGSPQGMTYISFDILVTSLLFGAWIFATLYLADFFSKSD